MDTEEKTPDPEFVKGFNEGYIMAQHEPELAEKISASLGPSERGTGFQSGRLQYTKEMDKTRYPSWLTRDYKQDFQPDKDHTKEEREPDKDKS